MSDQDDRISPATSQDAPEESAPLPKKSSRKKGPLVVAALALALCLFAGIGAATGFNPFGSAAQQTATEQSAHIDQASSSNTDTKSGTATSKSSKASSSNEKSVETDSANSADKTKATSAKSSTKTNSSSSDTSKDKSKKSSKSDRKSSDEKTKSATIQVHIKVDASAADDDLDYKNTFANTTVTLKEGASVYDALKATGLKIKGDSTYVKAINGLAEKMDGSKSGWMYSVNGTVPMKSCGKYELSDGDNVRWYYVTGD